MNGKLQMCGSFQGNFRCRWTIDSFSSLDRRLEEFYLSEAFHIENNDNKWFLALCSGGKNAKAEGKVICTLIMPDLKEDMKITYNASFHNTDGEILKSSLNREMLMENAIYLIVMEREALKCKLVDDILVVTVEARYSLTAFKDNADVHLYGEVDPLLKLSNDLRKLWTSRENTDVIISVGENDIPVHSNVLGARSEVFAAMFRHDTLEKSTRRVKVTDFEKETMDSFMEFIYSGNVLQMDYDLALELLRASDKYEVSDLKSYCSNYLMSLLDDENVSEILVSADTYNAKKLRGHAMEFFCKNRSKEDFETQRPVFKTRPELLCDIIVTMFERNKH